MISRLSRTFCLLTVSLLAQFNSWAGEERFNSRLEGTAIQVGANVMVQDDKFHEMQSNPTGWNQDFTNQRVMNVISLQHNPEDSTYYGTAFTAKVGLDITWVDAALDTTVVSTVLQVDYDPAAGSSYQDLDAYRFYDAHWVSAEITSITPSSGFPGSLALESEIRVERYYTFDPAATTAITAQAIDNGKQLEFSWNTLTGAEEYDLEWIFVNDYDTSPTTFRAASDLNFDFENGAIRVTTADPFYTTPLVFEHGYILYRVRAVGRFDPAYDTRWEGSWSVSSTAGLVSSHAERYHHTNPPEGDQFNWGASLGYAEKGRQGFGMGYADGLGRSRQSVALINSLDETIIGETVYDSHGRPAIGILPVPSDTCRFDFYPDFNTNTQGNAYGPSDFDLDPDTLCGLTAEPMSTNSGASRYFSPANPNQKAQQAYLPDAEGYPFSQVEYMPDNTGRIRRASGVGPNHKLGSGHETRYFYADVDDTELARLFGTEIGDAKNYRKNAVLDANGQMSIVYVDLAGNPVATALAGTAPDSLSALVTNTGPIPDTTSLNNQNVGYVDQQGRYVLESVKLQLVESAGNHNFSYELTPETFTDSCLPSNFCYDCIYDLEISVIDLECGTEMVPGGPLVTTVGQLPLDTSCQNPSYTYSHQFSVYLNQGTYQVRKTLRSNSEAYTYYVDKYLEQDTCLHTYDDYLQAALDSADFSGCGVNFCETGCLDSLGTEAQYIANGGTAAQYQALFEACYLNCSETTPCEQAYQAMLMDVSPGGQYGLFLDTSLNNDPSQHPLSVFNTSNQLPGTDYNWRHPASPYLDEDGNPDSILLSSGTKVIPGHDSVSFEDFRDHWKSSWAESLVSFHPEYCSLDWCESNLVSHRWNNRFNRPYYYELAADSGYMNPLDMTTSNGLPSGLSGTVASPDPFFATGGSGNPLLGSMRNRLENYLTIGGTTYTIWEAILLETYCPDVSTAAAANTCLSSNPAWGTDTCMMDLLWFQFNKLYQSAKGEAYDSLMLDYAIINGCYSGCIGVDRYTTEDDSFDCYPVNQLPLCGTNQYNGFGDSSQPCDSTTYTLYENKIPRFSSPDGDTTGLIASIILDLDSHCINTCEDYADSWFMGLSMCGISSVDSISIRSHFIEICKLGCSAGDYDGSSSTPPDTVSSGGYHNFDEVLDAYGYNSDSCSAWMITGPYAFGHETGGATNLDTCGCNSILSNRYAYENNTLPAGVDTEVELFANDFGLLIPNLRTLACMCEDAYAESGSSWSPGASWGNASELYLDTLAATVPYDLGCNTCLSCVQFDNWTDSFALEQPNMVDSTYYNVMLANYLNNKLNMNLSPLEYANFQSWCDSVQGGAGDTLTLCNRPAVTIPIDTTNDCLETAMQIVAYGAQQEYLSYLENVKAEFREKFNNQCQQVYQHEDFEVIHDYYEYHHTLYYYDQAGNLLRTVPPAGVKPFSGYQAGLAVINRLTNGPELTPSHELTTEYRYNSFGGLIETNSPDGGLSKFYYDHLGRLVLSQNERQANEAPNRYSYTEFDQFGRIKEVGELARVGSPAESTLKNPTALQSWIDAATKTEITRTFYDEPLNTTVDNYFANGQENLRLRVATIAFYDTDVPDANFSQATHYSYDEHGNVYEVIQDNPQLAYLGQQLKRITYDYELLSGNVLQVNYQEGQSDAFHHRYTYDEDNRLKTVETSQDRVFWTQDAKYHYYDHGPLARIETGEQQVHASDLAYTIQGWLKGVNSNTLDPSRDMGRDGFGNIGSASGALSGVEGHARFARDAAGFSLSYFNGDYKAISQPNATDHFMASTTGSGLANTGTQLYNGNIGHMVTAIQGFNVQATAYRYDQLNRLAEVNAFQNLNTTTNSWGAGGGINDYHTNISYDANGNILSLKRNGLDTTNLAMDDFTYHYLTGTNQLDYVDDAVAAGNYKEDLDDQSTGNYQYNEIGQLIADAHDSIALIEWTPYGKVKRITRTQGCVKPDMEFIYDATGNRIGKIVKPQGSTAGDWTTTWYALDASGSMMATYGVSNETVGAAGTSASGHFTVDGGGREGEQLEITVNGVSVTGGVVYWTTSASATATALANAINSHTSTPNYTASAAGSIVTITAALTGSSYNGHTIAATGSSTVSISLVQNLAGGTDPNVSYSASLNLNEHHLYGASRLGVKNSNHLLANAGFTATLDQSGDFSSMTVTSLSLDTVLNFTDSTDSVGMVYGLKLYEFSNHLGNVLATFSDRKLAIDSDSNGFIDYFSTDVLSRTDYYAFGMLMPGRNENANKYRFGMNGMEKDNEVSGTGNSYTTYFRSYDPRIGRWRSIDPVTHSWQTPYNAFDNNPIVVRDPSGADGETGGGEDPILGSYTLKNGTEIEVTMSMAEGYLKWGEDNKGTFDDFYCATHGGCGSDGNLLLSIWDGAVAFDTWMKSHKDWDTKGNTTYETGSGSKGEYGGLQLTTKKGDESTGRARGSALQTTQRDAVEVTDGDYLPGATAGKTDIKGNAKGSSIKTTSSKYKAKGWKTGDTSGGVPTAQDLNDEVGFAKDAVDQGGKVIDAVKGDNKTTKKKPALQNPKAEDVKVEVEQRAQEINHVPRLGKVRYDLIYPDSASHYYNWPDSDSLRVNKFRADHLIEEGEAVETKSPPTTR